MWSIVLQIAVLGFVIVDSFKNAMCTFESEPVLVDRNSILLLLTRVVAGHCLLCILFKKYLTSVVHIMYYTGFFLLTFFCTWDPSAFYFPVFVAHFGGTKMIKEESHKIYANCISFLLLRYTNWWWDFAFLFGAHGILIATFMYAMGKPALRAPNTIGYYVYHLLGKYYCFADKIGTSVLKFVSKYTS